MSPLIEILCEKCVTLLFTYLIYANIEHINQQNPEKQLLFQKLFKFISINW
jgi:hypothetical protein